jgi:hypothetical protein
MLIILVLLNVACPIGQGQGVSPTQIEMALTYGLLQGLALKWYFDAATRMPDTLEIDPLPQALVLSLVPGLIGWFLVQEYGQPVLRFPVIALSATLACVDFDQNGSCLPGADAIMEVSPDRRIMINNPYAGVVLAAAAYSLILFPSIVAIQQGIQYAKTEVGLRMLVGTAVLLYTLALVQNFALLPHLPVGLLGALTVLPILQITNPNGFAISLLLSTYLQSGLPMELLVNNQTASSHSLTIPAKATLALPLLASTGFLLGWGYLRASAAFTVSVIYRTLRGQAEMATLDLETVQESDRAGEAGISAGELNTCHIVAVEGSETAVAIVNPTSQEGTLQLTLRDENEQIVAQKNLVLPSMNQVAKFALELVDREDLTDFKGSLLITGNVSVGTTSLNTNNGFQSSSLRSATANDR